LLNITTALATNITTALATTTEALTITIKALKTIAGALVTIYYNLFT